MSSEENAVPFPPLEQKAGLMPSQSTNLTLLGGAIGAITMAILGKFDIYFDAGIESAFAVVFAALLGYLPESGRR